ncbi:MAG: TetR/AcrR family transcriptional regulator [Legionellales bacterium]|nr:TetR/AcrR family transcriptional regulator [Legionellales bacterium]
MNTRKPSTRTYNASARQAKARLSRTAILATAQSLFTKQGFENTNIHHIAEVAGVSEQTIYALFKSKLGILRAVMDECFSDVDHAELVNKAEQTTCPQQGLALAAKLARNIYDAERQQLYLLQGASALSPELKQLEQEREQRRHHRLSHTIKTLFAKKYIDEKLSLRKAHDIFWAFTGRDLYRLLVIEQGWSSNYYEQWLAETLSRVLLKNNL